MSDRILTEFDQDKLLDALQTNAKVLMRLLKSDIVDVVDTEQSLRSVSDAPFAFANFIAYVNLSNLKEVDDILADYQNTKSLWYLMPASTREIAGEGLLANGFTLIEERPIFAAMIEDVMPSAVPDFEVVEVKTLQQVEDWISVQSNANSGYADEAFDVYRKMFDNVFVSEDTLAYVAYDDGKPVGCAILLFAGGVAGFYQLAVHPDERRRGVGTALAAHRMKVALERGYKIAGMMVTTMGKTIHSKLGFKEIGKVHLYMQV